MSRSYKGIRAKKNRVYSVEDLQRLYKVSANTVSNWVGAGLQPSDETTPYVFSGAAVSHFHKQRRERSRTALRAGEFKCGGCKLAVFPDLNFVSEWTARNGAIMLCAACPECPSRPVKIASQADCDLLTRHRNPNTTVDCGHEDKSPVPGGIWIEQEKDTPDWRSANDRIIHKWQLHAGRHAEKTIDQHLAAIRYCEQVTGGRSFEQFTIEDASMVRETLKTALSSQSGAKKSKSTVAHIAAHLTSFFTWLVKQPGFKRLPQDLPDYFKLPRAVYSKSLPQPAKEYPSLEEAEALLEKMPTRSLLDNRARALFALAFLGALRADTLVSLRICHVEPIRKRIAQDASVVRAKNGKSLYVYWFPIPESFVEAVTDWIETLKRAGFKDQDALFPSNAWLSGTKNPQRPDRTDVESMSTTHAVTEAFAVASRNSATKYTPHSAKHTIAAERDKLHLTQEQRKAWSENMGHETEQITQSHYGKLSDDRRVQLLEEIGENETFNLVMISDAKKVELFDKMMATLSTK